MNLKRLVALLAVALVYTPALLAQAGSVVLSGLVRAPGGAPVAGVAVTLESAQLIGGGRATATDGRGRYRFPALPPGDYIIRMTLAGHRNTEARARLRLGETVRVDATLEPGTLPETARSSEPVVSEMSSIGSQHLPAAFLAQMPIAPRFGPAPLLFAPGVNPGSYSAYGSLGPSVNAYRLEGLNSSDPEAGGPWVFPAQNWFEEVHVIGHGASAEYGGFTGIASEALFRSGGSAFHGLAEMLYQNSSLTGANVPDDLLAQNPALAGATIDLLTDTSLQAGGPLKRDAVWFFAGAHFYHTRQTPPGYPALRPAGIPDAGITPPNPSESSPRVLFKPTWRLSSASQLSGFAHAERDLVQARDASAGVAPEATQKERSATAAWNGHFTRVMSPSTVFDVGYSGFRGNVDLLPYNGDTPGWYDVSADYYAVNASYFRNAARGRHLASASLTKFHDAHELKAGAEVEAGSARTAYHYPGGRSIDASAGAPFFLYLWDGSATDAVSRRYTGYAQDSWAAGAGLTLNAGLRFDRITGFNRHLDDQVYATASIAPRVGIAWAPGRNSRTVVRGHYGWYVDAAKSGDYSAVDPEIAPVYGVDVDRRLNRTGAPFLLQPGANHAVAAGLKQPRLKEAIVGVERHLPGGILAAVYAIDRRTDRFVDDVLRFDTADFTPIVVHDAGPDGFSASGDETASTATVYSQRTNPAANQFTITNPPGAFRTSQAVEVTASKRLAARWEILASWVVSKTTGNYDPESSASSADFEGPNTDPALQPFRTGRVAGDATHVGKLFGTYRLPLGVSASGALYYTSGATFTRSQGVRVNQGRVDVFVEPRGSQRYDAVLRLDARLERQFSIGGSRRIGITADGFNLLNDATVTSRITQSGLRYFLPQSIVPPRQFRIGGVFRF